MGDELLGAGIAFCVAVATTPVGVSGAVFLIPVQISVLETPSPAITPTNLLYNLVAIPGALLRHHQGGRLGGPLVRLLLLGTLPGVIVGAVVRVELLAGADAFLIIVAAVLVPLGAWLAFLRPRMRATDPGLGSRPILALALAVGVVGGIYGIGGGSILAPILVGVGYRIAEVAPAALMSTFVTSIAGIATYAVLALGAEGEIAPDWVLGLALGLGGLLGTYVGASLQDRLPELFLRRLLGALALIVGLRYLLLALT